MGRRRRIRLTIGALATATVSTAVAVLINIATDQPTLIWAWLGVVSSTVVLGLWEARNELAVRAESHQIEVRPGDQAVPSGASSFERPSRLVDLRVPKQIGDLDRHPDSVVPDNALPELSELQVLLAQGERAGTSRVDPYLGLVWRLEAIRQMRRHDQSCMAVARLPELLRQLYGAIDAAPSDRERERVYALLAQAYANTAQLAYRFGCDAVAAQAVDRMERASDRCHDPMLQSHAIQQRCLLLMSYASFEQGDVLVGRSLDLLSKQGDSDHVLALRGSAHLRGAIMSACARQADRAGEHIGEARRLASRLGRTSSAFDTNFGPANVEIHEVTVSLEIGDPAKAARDGSSLHLPADTPPSRVGHHWQDVARAWALNEKWDNALRALNQARIAAPEQTRFNRQVRETVRAIANAEPCRPDNIFYLTTWLGISG